LQLALGHLDRALERVEAVIQRLHQVRSRNYLAEAHWLQGRARVALGEVTQAREALQEAKVAAQVTSERPILWQVLVSLAEVEETCSDAAAAGKLRDQARAVVGYIAEHAGELRDVFLGQPAVAELLGGARRS
jgi:predicted negative regulator of RcsB-dependent stress response